MTEVLTSARWNAGTVEMLYIAATSPAPHDLRRILWRRHHVRASEALCQRRLRGQILVNGHDAANCSPSYDEDEYWDSEPQKRPFRSDHGAWITQGALEGGMHHRECSGGAFLYCHLPQHRKRSHRIFPAALQQGAHGGGLHLQGLEQRGSFTSVQRRRARWRAALLRININAGMLTI